MTSAHGTHHTFPRRFTPCLSVIAHGSLSLSPPAALSLHVGSLYPTLPQPFLCCVSLPVAPPVSFSLYSPVSLFPVRFQAPNEQGKERKKNRTQKGWKNTRRREVIDKQTQRAPALTLVRPTPPPTRRRRGIRTAAPPCCGAFAPPPPSFVGARTTRAPRCVPCSLLPLR
jgi:hypothetical protein